MKRLCTLIVALFVANVAHAWLPDFIKNSSDYQGANSVINIASGTIVTLNVTNFNTSGDSLNISSNFIIDAGSINMRGLPVIIGNDSESMSYADGDGDLYVEDELEVDTAIELQGNLRVRAGASKTIELAPSYIYQADDIEHIFGTDNNYSIGHDSGLDEFRLVTGSNITTDANVLTSWNSQGPIFKSSTTAGLNGTTPKKVGEYYFNTDTNELWIATGTAINDFVHK